MRTYWRWPGLTLVNIEAGMLFWSSSNLLAELEAKLKQPVLGGNMRIC
jgi:hypothetical protein